MLFCFFFRKYDFLFNYLAGEWLWDPRDPDRLLGEELPDLTDPRDRETLGERVPDRGLFWAFSSSSSESLLTSTTACINESMVEKSRMMDKGDKV